jgi:RNA polymerase sigma-70 factor, ECF subfamily
MPPADNVAECDLKDVCILAEQDCSSSHCRLLHLSGTQGGDSEQTESLIEGGRGDEKLLAQARASTDPAVRRELLNQLFDRYQERIARWCFRITGERDSAADLAQEVLIKVYRALDLFRGDSKFSTWLYAITRNHCVNDSKRRAARCENTTAPIEDDLPSSERFESKIECDQMMRQMRRLLRENLDETERRVMVLHYGEEMSLDAITRLLGLTNTSGAKAYIVNARRKLKSALSAGNSSCCRKENVEPRLSALRSVPLAAPSW